MNNVSGDVSQFIVVIYVIRTACAHRGKNHFELTSLWVISTPSTTFLSTTSVPITAGFIGLGYFRHAACATVSHGWLQIN